MDVDKLIEDLSQEERLELLERLIQNAAKSEEKDLSVEERLERLEDLVWGGGAGFGPWHMGRRRFARMPFRGHRYMGRCCW